MGVLNRVKIESVLRFQQLAVPAWSALGSPKLTRSLAVCLVIVILLGLSLPQQSAAAPVTGQAAWIAALPPVVQLWGEPLYFLGFARIFHSLWFWLPLALLFLNGLIAVADFGPGSWQRLGHKTPPVEWQHPLARRAEQSVRLPESPDTFLAALKKSLVAQGFYIYEAVASEQRVVGAGRHRRSWAGPAAIYIGLILVAVGALFSFRFSKIDNFTLVPFETGQSRLFGGQFELTELHVGPGLGQVIYTPADGGQSQVLIWRLYQPFFLNGTLVWPFATEPVLTIEVRDSQAALLKLIPVQDNLPPAEHLNLLLAASDAPLYFSIPAANMAVQVLPDPAALDQAYDVRVWRGSESAASAGMRAEAGQALQIDNNLALTMTPNFDLKVIAYRDLALFLYLLAFLVAAAGGLVLIFLPPRQVWLIAEVKGRGGKLYGVVEQFGSRPDSTNFLDRLLNGAEGLAPVNPSPVAVHVDEAQQFQESGVP